MVCLVSIFEGDVEIFRQLESVILIRLFQLQSPMTFLSFESVFVKARELLVLLATLALRIAVGFFTGI